MASPCPDAATITDYLAWENTQPERHELFRGHTRRVEVYRRNERGLFELHDQTDRDAVEFACVGFTLPMTEVFDGVEDAPAA